MKINNREKFAFQSWKKTLEDNFRAWVEELDGPPEDLLPQKDIPPDMFSFYSELCTLRSEIHRSAKRDHEAYVDFRETLTSFENTLKAITKEQLKLVKLSSNNKSDDACQKAFRLSVVDLYERFRRIEAKLEKPPAKKLFGSKARWRNSWTSLRDGFYILRDHFQNLLNHQEIYRMKCEGRPFDPYSMKAIDFESMDTVAPNTVVEELSGGYFYQKSVLKYAEVKVAVAKGDF